MRLKNQPEWAVDVLKKMLELRLAKKDVAVMLKINRNQFYNIMNGNVINTTHKNRIIECVNKLYEKRTKSHV